jgi:hypothetical protein
MGAKYGDGDKTGWAERVATAAFCVFLGEKMIEKTLTHQTRMATEMSRKPVRFRVTPRGSRNPHNGFQFSSVQKP